MFKAIWEEIFEWSWTLAVILKLAYYLAIAGFIGLIFVSITGG